MESTFQQLHSRGVGAASKHAEVISKEEEELLWKQNVLSCHSPKALLRAVFFFLNEKTFVCKAARNTEVCNFHSLRGRKITGRTPSMGLKISVVVLAILTMTSRSFVSFHASKKVIGAMLNCLIYVSKLPNDAKKKGAFHFTPLRETPSDPQKSMVYCNPSWLEYAFKFGERHVLSGVKNVVSGG